MFEKIFCESKWRKADKRCRIVGETEGKDYTFRIYGWNPLPYKSFVGTYHVLANWLIENGWEREKSDNTFSPDTVCIHVR